MRPKGIKTIQDFSQAMRESRDARLRMCGSLLEGGNPASADVGGLQRILRSLESIPLRGGRRTLAYDGKSLSLDLSYEIGELEKDLLYLAGGEEALLDHLAGLHPGFAAELEAGRAFLAEAPREFLSFVTDRDGTVNNYCGRYYSSIQSVYNAVFLTRFARRRCGRAVILTSAPLEEGGLVDVSVVPPGNFVLAGSKGREALDEQGRRHRLPIPAEQQAALDRLNHGLARLLEQPEFEIFGLVGSGLQFKFGQSTVAHQDVYGSIPTDLSRRFRESVATLILELDPGGKSFRTEDTGKDLEILLTVSDTGRSDEMAPAGGTGPADGTVGDGNESARRSGGDGLRDFDKGDGVRFLDRTLGLHLDRGPNLVCGDTPSDLPMIEAATRTGGETWSIFITRDNSLREEVRTACPQSWFASKPDILVALLNELGREKR